MNAPRSGYRLPAEWEPQEAVFLVPSHNPETWPGCLELAQAQFAAFMDVVRTVTPVIDLTAHGIPTCDSWIRDYGPITLVRCDTVLEPARLMLDFTFNSWGGKYDDPQIDSAVPRQLGRLCGLPVETVDLVLEGGAIEVDGCGTLLTTSCCLEHPSRNPQLDRLMLENKLGEWLGVTRVIWLPGAPPQGDDTDGHVDNVARFLAPGLVACVGAPEDHPDAASCQENLTYLRQSRDARNQKLDVVELPVPPVRWFDYPGDRFTPARREMLPGSYANFLFSNNALFVPVFGGPTDDLALRRLADVLPRVTIVPVPADVLVVGQGGLHCLSMTLPAL